MSVPYKRKQRNARSEIKVGEQQTIGFHRVRKDIKRFVVTLLQYSSVLLKQEEEEEVRNGLPARTYSNQHCNQTNKPDAFFSILNRNDPLPCCFEEKRYHVQHE